MNKDKTFYGSCTVCGEKLEPIWSLEDEKKRFHGEEYKTGRKIMTVNELWCACCLKKTLVNRGDKI